MLHNTDENNNQSSLWFAEFLKSTNEKKIISKIIMLFIEKLNNHDYLNSKVRILDIGSGEGELAASIVDQLLKYTKNIDYQAIDNDEEFNNKTEYRLHKKQINYNIVTGNCFGSDIDFLDNQADLVIASNIAYYADDIEKFTDSLHKKLSINGISLYIHQTSDSEVNILRRKYSSEYHSDTVNAIKTSFERLEATCFPLRINSNIFLPDNFHELIEYLKNSGSKSIPEEFYNTKLLLEFIVQTSLESLEEKGQLSNYIDDLLSLDSLHQGRLVLTSDFQIIPSCLANKKFVESTLPKIIDELYIEHKEPEFSKDKIEYKPKFTELIKRESSAYSR